MNKVFLQFLGYFAIIFATDQLIKWLFLQGFRWQSDFIDLVLVYNKGVAFSMLAFLEGNLKYLQIALIALLVIYLIIAGIFIGIAIYLAKVFVTPVKKVTEAKRAFKVAHSGFWFDFRRWMF